MHRKLFRPSGKFPSRGDLACEEGVKAKRCLGALRYLWRSSSEGAHDEKLRDMKSYLQDSPLQGLARPKPGPPHQAPESQVDESQIEEGSADEDQGGCEGSESEIAAGSDEAASDPDDEAVENASAPDEDSGLDAETLIMGKTSSPSPFPSSAEGGECGESEGEAVSDPVVEVQTQKNDGQSLSSASRQHLIVIPPLEDILACGQGSGWLGRMYADQHGAYSSVGEVELMQMIRDVEQNLGEAGLAECLGVF